MNPGEHYLVPSARMVLSHDKPDEWEASEFICKPMGQEKL